jgi:hypothetical protein
MELGCLAGKLDHYSVTKLSKPLFMHIIRRSSGLPNVMKILKLRFFLKMYTLYDGRRRGTDHGRT